VTVELSGIELHGFHGVLDHERREGQRFLVDVELDVAAETAAATDRISDAVD
jgi:7,8-dihydroneopterin aldolase/epimerase/oxygenase